MKDKDLGARRTLETVHNDKCKQYEKKIFYRYDKSLIVFWLPDAFRYSIWTKDKKGKAYMLYVCVDKEDKTSYREPNERDLSFIHQMDMYRKDKSYSVMKKIQEHNDKIEENEKKKLSETIQAISRDRWRQFVGNPIVNIPVNIGSLA